MDHPSYPQSCGISERRLCDDEELKQGNRDWVPLRDVLQGEGNYGPKILFHTRRDTFASASVHERVDLSEKRDDAVIAKRRFNIEIAKRQETRALSAALLCLRRERLGQVLRCDASRDEQHRPSQQASTPSSLISALPPLSSLPHH
ncbi:conserved hypothetical protein [Echinococcus multilocularis]|uniref:Uncharacterized protein n=1 Tax=Echinococcus multilocularis TaxID=6211 RepID=A0A087W057_ECHMU|nr:conserved hypothetical protein [Echinococcus multilocularis]